MKKRFKRHYRKNEKHHDDEVVLRFRNIALPTQTCLEGMGIMTQWHLQSAVDKYGIEGLIARMGDA